jgi:hypothetical protein
MRNEYAIPIVVGAVAGAIFMGALVIDTIRNQSVAPLAQPPDYICQKMPDLTGLSPIASGSLVVLAPTASTSMLTLSNQDTVICHGYTK